MRTAVLAGIGSCLPARAVSNDDLARTLDTSDEWIRSRTGIRQRYVAGPGETTSVLAAGAGARALKSAGRDGADLVVLATTTPDRPCPGTAPAVASLLGLRGTAAFDVSAVCSGFVYGLAAAAALIVSGVHDSALVIGAETFSTILDPADRSTSVIFGDGAAAVVLRAGAPGEPGALEAFDLGSDGDGRDLITVRDGGAEQRLSGGPDEAAGAVAGAGGRYFSMAGREVFWRAVQRMEQSARTALERAGRGTADVDRMVCHQANLRILKAVAGALGIEPERLEGNIADVGNTAAASIPLALDHAHAAGRLRAGQRLLLTAFGGGLTWGSAVLTWPDLPIG